MGKSVRNHIKLYEATYSLNCQTAKLNSCCILDLWVVAVQLWDGIDITF